MVSFHEVSSELVGLEVDCWVETSLSYLILLSYHEEDCAYLQ